MILAVVGSRDGVNLDVVQQFVGALHRKYPDFSLISGGARGVDSTAELTAFKLGHEVISLRPVEIEADALYTIERWLCAPYGDLWEDTSAELGEYQSYRDAAFARNTMIAETAERVIAFSAGSAGTAHTVSEARRLGKPIHLYDTQGAPLHA